MKIAIEGCAHGDLDKIFETVQLIENREKIKVDLLICCGDFQSVRNKDDMNSMAVPPKYREMKDFSQYYNGTKKAPVLTLFIGGNHESANYLWELPYGGWVAENIYYMGYASVVNFAGLRIGGLSGIYKNKDYYKGHFESPPFNEDTKRSFYHVRSLDVAKLKLMNDVPFDIFLSHDWPKRIYHFGDKQQLIKFKPFLRDEINSNTLGSDAAEELLKTLQPAYWFSGHMHAKFSALVPHSDSKTTRFLALDKCLPRRNFLQVIDVGEMSDEPTFMYDKYWLAVLQSTNNTFSRSSKQTFLTELPNEHKPTEKKVAELDMAYQDFKVFPFTKSVKGQNEQTALFCSKFNLDNPCNSNSVIANNQSGSSRFSGSCRKKMVLSQPNQKKVIIPKSIPTENIKDDDFGELTNPNTSSNPDEIDVNDDDDESEDSDHSEIEDEKDSGNSSEFNLTPINMNLSVNEQPSFIETPLPFKTTSRCDISSSDAADVSSCVSDEKDSCSDTPIPKKKFKLVRRNQNIYTPSNEDDS